MASVRIVGSQIADNNNHFKRNRPFAPIGRAPVAIDVVALSGLTAALNPAVKVGFVLGVTIRRQMRGRSDHGAAIRDLGTGVILA